MKKYWFLILLVAVAITIAIIIIISTYKEKKINHFDFPNTILVKNYTDYKRADTLAMVILNKIFSYDSIEVNIFYMTTDIGNNEIDVQAFIQKNPFVLHNYYLFIKNGTLSVPIDKVISHEMIHVRQMETRKFIQIDADTYIYDNKMFRFSELQYDKRPPEIDAFNEQNKILRQLNNLLYRK